MRQFLFAVAVCASLAACDNSSGSSGSSPATPKEGAKPAESQPAKSVAKHPWGSFKKGSSAKLKTVTDTAGNKSEMTMTHTLVDLTADEAVVETEMAMTGFTNKSTNKFPLKPGIYQVRVAARDDRTGRVGSTARWIEVPDLAQKRLTLSNLMLNGQLVGSKQKEGAEQVQFSVDHRFKKGSHLNFLTIVYNAAPGSGGAPDLESQIRISRDGQPIVNTPARKIGTPQGTDLARVPYGADIALNNLPAGRYVLQVTVNDRAAKTSATQQTTFDIE